ncbi:SDR family oxidoreductase [Fulvivirga sediminis]|uniref:SDR family oxidoreductase n=1 Tax=Fulvivirga sediminis TaxID=2803949 RepID=A0A937FDZ3_9BACT|nr:SDR family oxidoreductase [Fulvivirga sediminis]MBL3658783.1 SDR family oxidoreductase [Fulvivirga sediminis]
MILITGATSGIGHRLCQLLAGNKHTFRAMCRKEEQIKEFEKEGIKAVLGNFKDYESLKIAMQGCERLFLLTPPHPEMIKWEKSAIDAAKASGIKYIVKISASDANVRSAVPWAKSHAIIDHHLRDSGIDWTILKPTAFMQNFLSSAKPVSKGFLPQVAGKGKVGYIHTDDIANVAFCVITEDKHSLATYYLSAPEALDMQEIADQFTTVLDKKVKYVNLPKLAFRALLRLSGVSSWFASGTVVQFAEVVARSHALDISKEVYRLTKSEPKTFVEFIRENKKIFETGS